MILDNHTRDGFLLNKIQWLEWGKESFERAKSLGRPILLDITGSWCHWCHVMDNTSYSDPAVIDLVNKNFIAVRVAVNFDIDYGGFGFEPKFPHTEALEYALLRYRYHGEKEMLTVVTKTLDKMGTGGVYDRVEQGFFRYSTTRDWSIPHFEKMAEDNAKLLAVYLHAFQITGKALYRDVAEGIVEYVNTSLSDSEHGGFFGSQDADEEYYKLDLAKRKTRKSPAVDKTLYTNYNALFISSFLLSSIVLDRPEVGKF